MPRTVLIDGDMVAYRCAASCLPSKKKAAELGVPFESLEPEPLETAIFRANDLLYRIVNTCQADEHRVFISGDRNYRKALYPDYKAHRAAIVKPPHLEPLRELLVREWQAEICDGYEADDGIGMAHNEHTVIASNDKDFKQLVGEHYNPIKDEFEVVDSLEAAYNFYHILLKGDAADGIRGVDGIGEVKAGRILRNLTPEEMHSRVRDLYGDEKRFLLNFSLVRILTSIEEYHEIEASIRESQGEEPTETGGSGDTEDLSGANQE